MSVINKMLRDLDQRKSNPAARGGQLDKSLRSGTSVVSSDRMPSAAPPQARTRWATIILPGLVVGMAALVWEWQAGDLKKWQYIVTGTRPPVAPPPMPAALLNPATATVATESVPVAAVPAQPASAQASNTPLTLITTPTLEAAAEPAEKAAPQSAPQPQPQPQSQPASVAAKVAPPKSAVSVAKPAPTRNTAEQSAPASNGAVSAPPAADPNQRQIQAGYDALTQAQSAWGAGNRESAIDLLSQAMKAAERLSPQGPAQSRLLGSLAREWGRMQLAEGRSLAVYDQLVRLEPQLRQEPDVWAMRANAAQRLGRHQDSVNDYLAALQLRAGEQRWMLGAAVSMAALGQTSAAAEMAERARAVGSISPDVQTYLRQAGVPLKDK